jgi:chorismate dehydratase
MLHIAAVSYLNTFPFVYGLREANRRVPFTLDLAVPSECARLVKEGRAGIGLVPVGALPELKDSTIFGEYCIGATGPVQTVLLLSQVPLREITAISLDMDSRTSVKLVRVLAERFWKISPEWKNLDMPKDPGEFPVSMVAIGDKTFTLRKHYRYIYDLSQGWYEFTGLPFVFAVWVKSADVSLSEAKEVNRLLGYGVDHLAESVEYFRDQLPGCEDCLMYLQRNISYPFDAMKRRGLERFLSYI